MPRVCGLGAQGAEGEEMSDYTKPTAGPWWRSDEVVYSGKDLHIAVVSVAPDNWKANARLIAAAPELLRALMAASNALRAYQYGNSSPDLAKEIANAADAAIAKAEGTS